MMGELCLRRVIAVDFDGTLCTDRWPGIGEPRWDVIKAVQAEQAAGSGVILWTCREGDLLAEAVAAAASWGLKFDAVNANHPDRIAFYGNDPRKIGASEYWDDRAVPTPRQKHFATGLEGGKTHENH